MNLIKEIMQEPTPCDGCIHKSKCGDGRLACDAFALYVDNGRVNWVIPRLPTRRTYNQTMRIGQGESAIIRRIKKKLRQKETA
jgi:hypothetical protein